MKSGRWILGDTERNLFYGLLIINLLPLWLSTYFPSQDGPAHLYNARIIGDWYWSDFSIFREYLTLNERLDPTWFDHIILAALMKFFSPNVSEKLFLTVYILALPLSIRYALGVIHPGARFLSVLAFPLLYNALLHYGFYSFAMSLAVYCFFIGYWLQHAETINFRVGAWLVLITLLLFLTHVVTMALAYLSAAVMSATWWMAEVIRQHGVNPLEHRTLGRRTWNLIIKPLFVLLPAATLLFLFFSDRERVLSQGPGLYERLQNFVHLDVLYVFRHHEWVLSSVLAFVFWALTLWFIVDDWGRCKLQRQDVLMLLAAVLTVSYFLAPDPKIVTESSTPGGPFITERLNLFPYLALLLWLGTREFSARRKRFVQLAGTSISLAFIIVHISHYVAMNHQIDEYLSAIRLVEPGTTLLPVHASPRGLAAKGAPLSYKVDPFLHVSNRAGAERPIFILSDYEANVAYFPVRFRRSRNPYAHLGNIEADPPKLDLASYTPITGGRIDYVLVWLGRKSNTEHPNMKSIYSYLNSHYKRIFISKNGLAELYRHNAGPD